MLRFDYSFTRDGNVNVTIVFEEPQHHQMVGRLVIPSKEWKTMHETLARSPYQYKFEIKETV